MDPVTYPPKLCPLRSFGPTFLGETSNPRNKSHSPQPPIRKRLYSEDFNSILLDVEINQKKFREKPKPMLLTPQIEPFCDQIELNEDAQVFSDVVINTEAKMGFFPDQEVEGERDEVQIFERGLLPLREESQFEEEELDMMSVEIAKEDKHKQHFRDIFDSGRKEILGKRAFMETGRGLGKRDQKGKKMKIKDLEYKKNLNLEENSTYCFNSKSGISQRQVVAKDDRFRSPKHLIEKKKKEHVMPAPKRDSRVSSEKRGSHVQGWDQIY